MNINDTIKILMGTYKNQQGIIKKINGSTWFTIEIDSKLIGYDITELEVI